MEGRPPYRNASAGIDHVARGVHDVHEAHERGRRCSSVPPMFGLNLVVSCWPNSATFRPLVTSQRISASIALADGGRHFSRQQARIVARR